MDAYFKFKMITEYIIPAVLFLIIAIICITIVAISTIKSNRIKKFFINNGYERELFGVPSFGDGAFYGWVRKSDGKRVDDRDIRGLSLKQIKKKYR